MAFNLDIHFESYLAANAPAFLINPTGGLEKSSALRRPLADLRGGSSGFGESTAEAHPMSHLRDLGQAPDFTDTQRWFNTPDGRPLSLAGLRGRVVLLDFWTYTCIDCLRTFPELRALDARYRTDGLTIVGVHTPEFEFEKNPGNVAEAIAVNHLRYPVVQDNDYGTWNAYANQYWPAKYLIDAKGRIRYVHFGEGDYGTTEKAIRSLLAERGAPKLGSETAVKAQVPSAGVTTPESYLGGARAQSVVNGPLRHGVHPYTLPANIPEDHLAYGGRWRIEADSATAAGASEVKLNFKARRAFLVLGSPGGPKPLRVLLDGHPIPDRLAGDDVRGGVATIDRQRLYSLVDLPDVQRHTLTLEFAPGISGYAFTFG
jgi:thiol-disulfide isomerase/thioredoxin